MAGRKESKGRKGGRCSPRGSRVAAHRAWSTGVEVLLGSRFVLARQVLDHVHRGSSRDDAAANLNPLPNGGSARGQPRRSKQRSGCECAGNEATVAEQVQERKTEMERRGGAGLWRRFYRFVAVVSTSPQDKAFHRTPYVHSCCVG
nr:uncharacterized protein LOC112939539 [Oryza sativa Japonica Group]